MVEQTGSTNADILTDPGTIEGDWLVALDQWAGKGRQGRSWISAEGNFFGSALVELSDSDPPAQTLSLVAGIALVEALDLVRPDAAISLKWPNDVMLNGRKLAGILLERSGSRIAVGFGVNLAASPDLPDRKGASLGGAVLPQAFAPLLAGSFARCLQSWRSGGSEPVRDAWLKRAHPLGARLTVHISADETADGSFDGLDSDGALRLRRHDGSIETIRAGDVQLG